VWGRIGIHDFEDRAIELTEASLQNWKARTDMLLTIIFACLADNRFE